MDAPPQECAEREDERAEDIDGAEGDGPAGQEQRELDRQHQEMAGVDDQMTLAKARRRTVQRRQLVPSP